MYTPSAPPAKYSVQYLFHELQKLATFLRNPVVDSLTLTELYVAPTNPQEGAVYYADGTSWNPGSGAGLYTYINSAYVLSSSLFPGEDWKDVPTYAVSGFENSWDDYPTVDCPARFYKDPFNVVHLMGMIDTGSLNTDAFTLPVGYRPAKRHYFSTASNSSTDPCRIRVDTDGAVQPQTGGTTWSGLSGISFRV